MTHQDATTTCPEEQRAYKAQKSWKQDPAVVTAPKKIASCYYQLKVGHAVTGAFLYRIKARTSASCQGCQASIESVRHLLLECREWRRQQASLYKALEKTKVALPSETEAYPEKRLLEDSRVSETLIQFLKETRVGCQSEKTAQELESASREVN